MTLLFTGVSGKIKRRIVYAVLGNDSCDEPRGSYIKGWVIALDLKRCDGRFEILRLDLAAVTLDDILTAIDEEKDASSLMYFI